MLKPYSILNSRISKQCWAMSKPSSDYAKFHEHVKNAKNVFVLTGAGISAESGIPTFRGEGGLWRRFAAPDLASPSAFARNPSLVWEFYHYRRELVLTKSPNRGHYALAEFEKQLEENGGTLHVVTQNIDELHRRAGTKNLLELHGNLFKTRCTKCKDIASNYDSPICEALRDKGAPDTTAQDAQIPVDELPRCKRCQGLLRPHIVWFGENLDADVMSKAYELIESCDLCLVVGTSSVVYPAAMFAPQVADRGIPVAEFNLESTPATNRFTFHFEGTSSETLPNALNIDV